MAGAVRKSKMKEVPRSEVKDDLSRFLREAEIEHDPRFIQRIEQARASFRAGRGVKLEDVK